MTKKNFEAFNWFQKDHDGPGEAGSVKSIELPCPVKNRFPTFVHHLPKLRTFGVELSDRFSPLNCFTPGWKGDSLSSKQVVKFEQLLSLVQSDIINELLKNRDFPRTIKMALYNEFLSYAESLGLHFNKMDDLSSFWACLNPERLEEELLLEWRMGNAPLEEDSVRVNSLLMATLSILMSRLYGKVSTVTRIALFLSAPPGLK